MIRATAVLLRHSARRMRTLLLVPALSLAGFQVLLALSASELQRTGTFAQVAAMIPGFLRELFGSSLIGIMSFSGVMALGYYHVAIVAVLAAISITMATEPAAEIEVGFADLILSRAVARSAVIARSAVLLIAGPAVMVGAMAGGTFVGLWLAAPADAVLPEPRLIARIAFNLWALLVCCGGVGLAIASVARRRSVAGSIAGAWLAAAMLTDYLSRVWTPLRAPARFSPFRYYNPLDMVMGRPVPDSDVWILLSAGAAGIIVAFVLFARRDV